MDSYSCDVCGKRFLRKDNLRQHKKKHGQYQCPDCPLAFSSSSYLDSHRLHKHNQTGRGTKRTRDDDDDDDDDKENASPKKKLAKTDDPKDYYTITPTGEQIMKKFNTTSKRYRVNFKDLELTNLSDILRSLRHLFSSIISDLTEFMDSSDLVRLTLHCPELDYPISIPFMRVAQLSADRILTEIERVLQSYEQFVIDQSLVIDIIHVRLPTGGGAYKRKCFVDLERDLTEKRCFIKIKNKDSLCCARAIITAKAKLENDSRWNSIRQGRNIQKELAEELHKKAGVQLRRCDIQDVKTFQRVLPEYQICVISKEAFNSIIFKGPEANQQIYLYLHDGHFDVITTMAGFVGRSYYCTKCDKGYNTIQNHVCNQPCSFCHKCHNDKSETWQYCKDCNRYFINQSCFDLHIKQSTSGNSTCQTYYRCRQCSVTINRNRTQQPHVCGEKYCTTCKCFKPESHKCYMKTIEEEKEINMMKRKNKKRNDYKDDDIKRWIFFDFECTQDDMIQCDGGHCPQTSIVCGNCYSKNCHSDPCQNGFIPRKLTSCKNCQQSSCGTYRHVPNLCVVHKVCEECLDEEEVDEHSFCSFCHQKQLIFSGADTRNEFCKWLFSEENEGTKVFCHNFKGYDSYPIVSYLYENAILPEVIMNGSKFMSIDIPHLKMKFLDSMNFIPMGLSKMPKAFGIPEMSKGYFPHLFNRKENQNITMDHLPDARYYNPDGMMPDDRAKFFKWFDEHKNDVFKFKKEIIKYCRSDVDILRRSCLKFRQIFIDMTTRDDTKGIDPFERCITIASACNLVFRTLFLERESIGIIPPQGYRPQDKQSIKALQWIKYLAHKKGIYIQHAANKGEKVIGPYKVDGYYETPEEKVVLEFHGDFWHGNPKCYAANTINKVVGIPMGDLYQRTIEKRKIIENLGFTYVDMWESDFDKEVENDADMKLFLDKLELEPPLEPRDAFFGGRTEAFKLHAEANRDTEIKYYDVTSLYPYINKTGKIPLGHPRIITENFSTIDCYEGIIKCRILPPRGLYMPVLPAKINNKLLFGLCRTCMTNQTSMCTHTDNDRMLTGTWVTDEVKKAIEKGYMIDKIYEVWQFDRISLYDQSTKTGGVFADYVNTFLKMKQEASDWPDHCKTEADKNQYISNFYEKEGIFLDYDNIKPNPGLRALAKLMLNSFWGKFGQRENLPRTSYITEPCEYFDLLTSDYQYVKDVSYVSDEMVRMQWVLGDDFIGTSGRTNVVIAAYTTAQARLKLYSYLEHLNNRVLYADTDSIVFTVKSGEWEPALGDYLGDLTDEIPGVKMTSFVTGGPKNYAFVVKNEKGLIRTNCKVKGITLNFKNAMDINFSTMKEMVISDRRRKLIVKNDFKIARNIQSTDIITKSEEKEYKLVFDKRVLKDDLTSVPYGF